MARGGPAEEATDQLDFSPRPVSSSQRGFTQLGLEHEDLSYLLREQVQQQQQNHPSRGSVRSLLRKLWGRRPVVPDVLGKYLDEVIPRARGFEQLQDEVRDEEVGSWRRRCVMVMKGSCQVSACRL